MCMQQTAVCGELDSDHVTQSLRVNKQCVSATKTPHHKSAKEELSSTEPITKCSFLVGKACKYKVSGSHVQ